MQTPLLGRLMGHASAYAVASLLVTLAGLISFPILTRVFTVSEYGLLNLVSSMLGIMVGLGKLGLQNSTIRFYAEAGAGKSDVDKDGFVSTALIGMTVTGTCATVAVFLFSELAPGWFWSDPRVRGLMILSAILVLVRVVDSCLLNILRAEERSVVYGVYTVARRYAALAIILFVVFNLIPGPTGFYAATIAAETLALAALTYVVLRRHKVSVAGYSPKLLRAMLAFGLPMAAYEMSSLLLSQGDRYVIQGVLGGDALGVYAAAYNFSEYAQAVLLFPFGMAIAPMLARTWESEGVQATTRFIEGALHFYVIAAVALTVIMAAVGDEALELFASKKYLPGAAIIPWVVAGMALDGANSMLGAGLYLNKRAKTTMALVMVAAAVNLALNFALVPTQGILGAAWATLITYCLLTIAFAVCGRRFLRIQVPWLHLVRTVAVGALGYFAAVQIHHSHLIVSILLRLAVAGAIYIVLLLVLDARMRRAVVGAIARLGVAMRRISAGSGPKGPAK